MKSWRDPWELVDVAYMNGGCFIVKYRLHNANRPHGSYGILEKSWSQIFHFLWKGPGFRSTSDQPPSRFLKLGESCQNYFQNPVKSKPVQVWWCYNALHANLDHLHRVLNNPPPEPNPTPHKNNPWKSKTIKSIVSKFWMIKIPKP